MDTYTISEKIMILSNISRYISAVIFSIILLIVPCSSQTQSKQATSLKNKSIAQKPPKLVLVIVVDQFRNDYLSRFADLYSNDGFKLLLKNGAYFANANYLYSSTYTACGHSTILTGSIPATTGIVGNSWFDRKTKRNVTSVSDANFVGLPSGKGSAPTRLLATTVGDQLQLNNNFQSRVIGISLKDRSAILPAGRSANAAYWFNTAEAKMQTSTYYMDHLPNWVEEFNSRKIPDSYFAKTWHKLLPDTAYLRSDKDDVPYEEKFAGGSRVFPHAITGGESKPGLKFYEDFIKSPWANDFLVDFAEETINKENLGQHNFPDLLSISFSANDILGHAFGPYSQEMEDMTLRTDISIGRLLKIVDKRVGLENTLVVFTADHGVAPIPEYATTKHLSSKTIDGSKVIKEIETALIAKYGEGHWIDGETSESIYFDLETLKAKKVDRMEAERIAGEAALSVDGVATYFTRTQLLSGATPSSDIARRVIAAYNVQRSGDLYLIPEPFAFFSESDSLGTTHGTPYSYDTHVPMIIMGANIKPGYYLSPSSPSDIAPTLSTVLKIEVPNGSVGRVLSEALE